MRLACEDYGGAMVYRLQGLPREDTAGLGEQGASAARRATAFRSGRLHKTMRLYQSLLLLVTIVVSVVGQTGQTLKPVADRRAAQNALFDEQYESDLRNFPERATSFGDYRYNDKLAEHSLDAIVQRNRTDEAFL